MTGTGIRSAAGWNTTAYKDSPNPCFLSEPQTKNQMTTPQLIQITEAHRKRKTVAISYSKGEGHHSLDERENPLPEFGKAFDSLLHLVAIILNLPESWLENCRVVGIKLDTLGGAQTVSLIGRKALDDASKEFVFVTPPRLLAHPSEPGSYTPPLTLAQAALIEEVIEQAKQYVMGNRAQGEIPFEDAEPAEPIDGDSLPLENMPASKPKRRRKGKKEVAS